MKVVFDKSLMNVLHRRNKKRRSVMWVDKYFIPDGNGFDFSGRVISGYILFDPSVSKGETFGSGEEKFVRQINSDFNPRAGKSFENRGIGVVNFNPLKTMRFEKLDNFNGGRKVVADSAIVNSN